MSQEGAHGRGVARGALSDDPGAGRDGGQAAENQVPAGTCAVVADDLHRQLGATRETLADRDQSAFVSEHPDPTTVRAGPPHAWMGVVRRGALQRHGRRARRRHEGATGELDDRPAAVAVRWERLDDAVDRWEYAGRGSFEHLEQRMCRCPGHERRH